MVFFRSESFNKRERNILAVLHFKVEQTTLERDVFLFFALIRSVLSEKRLSSLDYLSYMRAEESAMYISVKDNLKLKTTLGALCQSFIIVTCSREE